jgi:hypothetical protein
MRPLPKYYLYRIIQSCTYQDPFKILQWVENNPTNIRIFPTNIHLSPQGTALTALLRMSIQMLPDVRWVGFLPPFILLKVIQLFNTD